MKTSGQPSVQGAEHERSVLRSSAEVAAKVFTAGIFAGTCAVGAVAIAEQVTDTPDLVDVNFDNGIVIKPESAQPSDVLNDLFDGLTIGGAGLGSLVLAKRAGRQIRLSWDKKQRAISELADVAGADSKRPKFKTVAAVSLIGAGAGMMAGGFIDIAREVSHTQNKVGESLFDTVTPEDGGDNFLITNTSTPELANNLNIPNPTVAALLETAQKPEYSSVFLAPMHMEWHSAFKDGSTNKVEVLTAGMPSEMLNLPFADSDCTEVPVIAASELGMEVGQTLRIENQPVVVQSKISGQSGANLLPVIMNNEDFARCLQTNPEQPNSFVLAHGDQETIERLLEDAGFNSDDQANRVFVVSEEEFMDSTLQTGRNNVNGFVLNSLAMGMLFAGAALGNNTRAELANNRSRNTMLAVQGMDWKGIKKVYNERAEKVTLASSAVAVPAIVGFDYLTNSGTPGAALGPNAVTLLCVVGTTWTASRIGTNLAVRKEAKRKDMEKGYTQ